MKAAARPLTPARWRPGLQVSRSEILYDPDSDEDEALAELKRLAGELTEIDPPAFDGYHGFIWAEFIDRRLW
ncbi:MULTISPECIES: hypothetical protein [unclassified Kitasatospora]|uniref:hypothetical protein n=1 Tax=unclassified Kitasatospora TaxID=2633591 RepID=UPI000708E8E5|nr:MULTISPECIES: hypothetical protein [unclassified Kitasatospora]KQV19264.1 hypothetical protein ASC99_24275 [Kitasatospora sp. Root107]KRB77540.1 hypothetical protein ASE03_00475 [Kitasatospora sp. Root187]